jgi:hypothetical protein
MGYGYTDIQTPPINPNKNQQLTEIIAQALEVASKAGNKAANSNISQQIKDGLYTYSNDIQSLVDEMLKNRGAITQQQLNELDEKTKQAKFKLLEAESSNTFVRYGLYVAVAIFAFGTLWFLTRDKSQTNG